MGAAIHDLLFAHQIQLPASRPLLYIFVVPAADQLSTPTRSAEQLQQSGLALPLLFLQDVAERRVPGENPFQPPRRLSRLSGGQVIYGSLGRLLTETLVQIPLHKWTQAAPTR